MQDYQKTILSQYANSETLTQLITNFNGYIDPGPLFDEFYDKIWNVLTAEGIGLDVWGRIVGVGRVVTIVPSNEYFGFVIPDPQDYTPFNEAPFYNGPPSTENYTLPDDAYRTVILIKAATNIARTTSPVINSLLTKLFEGRGKCYVLSLGGMEIQYTFEFTLTPLEFSILTQLDILPRPTGVGISIVQIP